MVRRSGALALLIAAVACAPAVAAPIQVNVRVEGIHKTLFEGPVQAKVHKLDSGDGTGRHRCDGTNNSANPTPGPTLLGAFDTAMLQAHIAWKGKYSTTFEDFTIDKVGPDASDTKNGRYWGQVLNFKDTQVGGCQQKVKPGDRVLIAFNSFGHPKLKLTGPKHATAGKSFKVKVVDGESGKPVEGARVRGKQTNANGRVQIVLQKAGAHHFKARAKDAVRSNALKVDVSAA